MNIPKNSFLAMNIPITTSFFKRKCKKTAVWTNSQKLAVWSNFWEGTSQSIFLHFFIFEHKLTTYEGSNNKIKSIKRVTYDYRNFLNFRVPIYLIHGLILNSLITNRIRKRDEEIVLSPPLRNL